MPPSNLPLGPIKDYAKNKEGRKRVKLYKNKIFIFNKTSTSCITVYPLPEEIIKAQEEFDKYLKGEITDDDL